MNLDINKIIQESLLESVEGAHEAFKRSGKAAIDVFKGGTAEDEKTVANEFAKIAAEKAKEENPDVTTVAIDKIDGVGKKAVDIGRKSVDVLKDYPLATGAAAALAAGLGALALRKRMKRVSK